MRTPCLALALLTGCASPELVATIEDRPEVGFEPAMFDCAFGPQGDWLATTGGDGRVRIWDARDGAWIQDLPQPPSRTSERTIGESTRMAVSPTGDRLVQSRQGEVLVYALPARTLERRVHLDLTNAGLHEVAYVTAFSFAPDGRSLLAGGSGVWSIDPSVEATDHHERKFRGDWVVALDGGGLVAASSDEVGAITIRTVDAGPRVIHVPWFAQTHAGAAVGDHLLLAGRARDGALLVELDLHTGQVTKRLDAPGEGFTAISVARDRAALAGPGALVTIVDLSNMSILRQLEGHEGDVRAVAWSPSGDRLASVAEDGTARLWSVAR
jgi:WD40 repeat protein